jgi:hypothetical protein
MDKNAKMQKNSYIDSQLYLYQFIHLKQITYSTFNCFKNLVLQSHSHGGPTPGNRSERGVVFDWFLFPAGSQGAGKAADLLSILIIEIGSQAEGQL